MAQSLVQTGNLFLSSLGHSVCIILPLQSSKFQVLFQDHLIQTSVFVKQKTPSRIEKHAQEAANKVRTFELVDCKDVHEGGSSCILCYTIQFFSWYVSNIFLEASRAHLRVRVSKSPQGSNLKCGLCLCARLKSSLHFSHIPQWRAYASY